MTLLKHSLLLTFFITQVTARGGTSGGGGRGSKSSKVDRYRDKNQNNSKVFTFLLVQDVEKSWTQPPVQKNFSQPFSHFVDKAWSVHVNKFAFYYLPDNDTMHQLHNTTLANPFYCIYYLEKEDVLEHEHLVKHPVFYECEPPIDNETEVVCCGMQCCVSGFEGVTYLGKGAFTLLIFSTIGLIIASSFGWIYYSKTQEIKKRKAEEELFESKKIKNKKPSTISQTPEEKPEVREERLVSLEPE